MGELTHKAKSGSVGIYLSARGAAKAWLSNIFQG
jgi:hypothetical protein